MVEEVSLKLVSPPLRYLRVIFLALMLAATTSGADAFMSCN